MCDTSPAPCSEHWREIRRRSKKVSLWHSSAFNFTFVTDDSLKNYQKFGSCGMYTVLQSNRRCNVALDFVLGPFVVCTDYCLVSIEKALLGCKSFGESIIKV